MKRFIQGEDRTQATLLPELLDDYVADTNPVRVVDVFVDELDLPVGRSKSPTSGHFKIPHPDACLTAQQSTVFRSI